MLYKKEEKQQPKYTNEDLKRLQSYPLWRKIQITQSRILEFAKEFDNKIYVSCSGKDSAVVLDIVRKTLPDVEVPVVYADTGLEYPEIKEFVLSQQNAVRLKPEKSFRKVIEEYGYPLLGKEISKNIQYARKALADGNYEKYHRYVDGVRTGTRDGEKYQFSALSKLAHKVLESDIKVSDRCCYYMKKAPCRKYEKQTGRFPITGMMADESLKRRQNWIQYGCNIFEGNHPRSNPISFWTEQDVLKYIVTYNIPYPSIYGEILKDESGKYYTTGVERSGCVWCCFGVHTEKEPNRFQRLKQTHPKLWEYCMKDWDKGGLGMKNILEYIGVKTGENETDTKNQNSMSDL